MGEHECQAFLSSHIKIDLRRVARRSDNLVPIWPGHQEQVADHSSSESPSNPFRGDRGDNLSDELRAGVGLWEDDTVLHAVDRVGDTIEYEAIPGIRVWCCDLCQGLLRSVSNGWTFRSRSNENRRT